MAQGNKLMAIIKKADRAFIQKQDNLIYVSDGTFLVWGNAQTMEIIAGCSFPRMEDGDKFTKDKTADSWRECGINLIQTKEGTMDGLIADENATKKSVFKMEIPDGKKTKDARVFISGNGVSIFDEKRLVALEDMVCYYSTPSFFQQKRNAPMFIGVSSMVDTTGAVLLPINTKFAAFDELAKAISSVSE